MHMPYADYAFYACEYGGSVSIDDFPRLAARASAYIDYYTRGAAQRAGELDELKLCCCALVDKYAIIYAAQALSDKQLAASLTGEAEIKSESVGSYSRTLATAGESASAAAEAAEYARTSLAGICREYLSNTGMLYRGGARRCIPRI